jgi:hypothetical protein
MPEKINSFLNNYDELARLEEERINPQDYISDLSYRLKHTPLSNGEWITGDRGNGIFRHNDPNIQAFYELAGTEGIEYQNAEPNFEPFALDTVQIDQFSSDRRSNFKQATDALSILGTLKGDNTTYHECSDRKTIMEVPTEFHAAHKHIGGVGEVNLLNTQSDAAYLATIATFINMSETELTELAERRPDTISLDNPFDETNKEVNQMTAVDEFQDFPLDNLVESHEARLDEEVKEFQDFPLDNLIENYEARLVEETKEFKDFPLDSLEETNEIDMIEDISEESEIDDVKGF